MTKKTFTNTPASPAEQNVPDLKVWGAPNAFQLLFKASSQKEGWMKSTKAMQIDGVGCVVQVTTQQNDNVAESLIFVPRTVIEDIIDDNGELQGRVLIEKEFEFNTDDFELRPQLDDDPASFITKILGMIPGDPSQHLDILLEKLELSEIDSKKLLGKILMVDNLQETMSNLVQKHKESLFSALKNIVNDLANLETTTSKAAEEEEEGDHKEDNKFFEHNVGESIDFVQKFIDFLGYEIERQCESARSILIIAVKENDVKLMKSYLNSFEGKAIQLPEFIDDLPQETIGNLAYMALNAPTILSKRAKELYNKILEHAQKEFTIQPE